GRQLGFPTANLRLGRRRTPMDGIFAVRVRGIEAGRALGGVASLGTRPTVGGRVPLLETHVFDFAGDLYGREIEVEFVARLRDELRFENVDLMVDRIHRDAAEARAVLANDSTEEGAGRLADYKNTVHLPRTDFAMKADLARRVPAMLQWW